MKLTQETFDTVMQALSDLRDNLQYNQLEDDELAQANEEIDLAEQEILSIGIY